jgi:hypothetical protein
MQARTNGWTEAAVALTRMVGSSCRRWVILVVMGLAKASASSGELMSLCKRVGVGLVLVGALWGGSPGATSGAVVQSAEEAAGFPQATLACKLKMGPITEREIGSPSGTRCDATCRVISTLKGNVGKKVRITFRRHANGPVMPGVDAVKAGEVYLVMLRGETAPYEMFAAMKAVDAVVEPRFGPKPGDRLLAELVAMWESNDRGLRIAAAEQIGIMRDRRASEEVNAAAKSEDAETARAGLIAQYRMKIAPDAKRTMELFNEQMLDVWYQESGVPQRDPHGKVIWRREGGRAFLERGLPDFDYATYVRDGIKKDWVRKDDRSLYSFFGVPWKVQRKACVPELVRLLDDPDKRVRWWAVLCLAHTVENEDRPQWEQYQQRESEELAKWRKWWKEEGDAFMARPATQRTQPDALLGGGGSP